MVFTLGQTRFLEALDILTARCIVTPAVSGLWPSRNLASTSWAVIKIRQIAIIMRLIGPLTWGTFPSTGAQALVMHATKAKSR